MSVCDYEVFDRVGLITMNRPDTLNALNWELIEALEEAVTKAADDEATRVVVITGAGRGFCSGGDVTGGAPPPGATTNREQRAFPEAVRLLHAMPKPTIAMINGPVAGAGIGVAGACDLRFAAESATFLTAFARWGLAGDYGATYFWTKNVGVAKARELFMMNEKLDAKTAKEYDIFTRVFPDAQLREKTFEIANGMARTAASGWKLMKSSLVAAEYVELEKALALEQTNMNLSSRARAEKRASDGKA
ncbi:MAG: enoyl-CoA hydratase-related protein [Caulobacterales bacterium]